MTEARPAMLYPQTRRTTFTHTINANAKVESIKQQERQKKRKHKRKCQVYSYQLNRIARKERLSRYGFVLTRRDHITRSALNVMVPRGRLRMRCFDRLWSSMCIHVINSERATGRKRWSIKLKNVRTTWMVLIGISQLVICFFYECC